jgi:hypothetical protein
VSPLQTKAQRLGARKLRVRNGKRTRRALVRMRHVKARDAFFRWARQTDNLLATRMKTFWRSIAWHEWHLRGCP